MKSFKALAPPIRDPSEYPGGYESGEVPLRSRKPPELLRFHTEGTGLLRVPFRKGVHGKGSRLSKGTDPSSFCVCDGGKPTSRSSQKHVQNIKRGEIMQKHINYVDDGKSMRNMICAHNGVFPQGLITSFGCLLKHLNIQKKANLL